MANPAKTIANLTAEPQGSDEREKMERQAREAQERLDLSYANAIRTKLIEYLKELVAWESNTNRLTPPYAAELAKVEPQSHKKESNTRGRPSLSEFERKTERLQIRMSKFMHHELSLLAIDLGFRVQVRDESKAQQEAYDGTAFDAQGNLIKGDVSELVRFMLEGLADSQNYRRNVEGAP